MPRSLHDPTTRGRRGCGFEPADRCCAVGVVVVLAGLVWGCFDAGAAAGPMVEGMVRITAERELMGTRFRIDVLAEDARLGSESIEAAFAEVGRAEGILSNWDADSQISEVNRAAGVQPVLVSDDLAAVLRRAIEISVATRGAFDVTFASCGGLWSIRDRRVPTDEEIAGCLPHVDYRKILVDPQQPAVFITDPETRLGIAGLAKGYRVDRAAEVLRTRGITDFVVDGGGDMRVASSSPALRWPIRIAHPRRAAPLGSVELGSGAIATSGDYEWYFERDGVRYHHILDPVTGRPARGCTSVTVIAPTAVEADALATGLFVMGPVDGLALAERLPEVEALIIASDLTSHATSGFPRLAVPRPEGS